MKNISNILLAGIFLAILLLGACQKVVYPPIEAPTEVSFSDDVQPIFDSKCISCHGGNVSPELNPGVSYNELINGGYVDTENPPESEIIQKLYGSHDARATETEKQTILVWIEGGAINN